ncbi:MAG: SGNH/GDSL hydrolase family protein [Planctomycetota bacterium]|nr:SGNH/GDSL hydrolase family protein [Planctomycetota bacterium]
MPSTFSLPRRTRIIAVLVAGVVLLTGLAVGAAEKPVLAKGDHLAIAGDSITEQKIYSRYMEDYLTMCTPQLDIGCIQLGWGGERAPGFLARMNQDLLPFRPTVVTTCYGMNDGSYRAYDDGIGKTYGDAMREIVERLKKAGATVVIGSPGAVDTNAWKGPADVYNENLGRLKEIGRQLAADQGMPFANVHDPMIEVMKKAKAAYGPAFHVCGGDGVHPAADGQLVMAYAFLKVLVPGGDIGTFTVDMAGDATATDGHKVLSAKGGTVQIESARYPFCFTGDEKSPDSAKSILPYLPFNEDLNRLTLIVKNLKGDKAKVTWGAAGKTFTREQLAKGINLAAEFLDNPFSEPFRKVDEAVAKKQGYETFLIKESSRALSGVERNLGDDAEVAAAVKTLKGKLLTRHDALAAAVRAARVPVNHTIVVAEEK